MPRDKWYFAAAVVWLAYASPRLHDLYESRDLSEDWGGIFTLGTALLFLYGAYRKPKNEASAEQAVESTNNQIG